MPIKSSCAHHMKHLKTKYPTSISKRSCISPINSYITQNEFKMMLPPKIKDSVRVKGAASEIDFDCVPLMTSMLSCLKSHNYLETSCSAEIKQFNDCTKLYNEKMTEAVENEKKGIYKVEEGQRRYPGVLVNKLLKKYKQPDRIDTGPKTPS